MVSLYRGHTAHRAARHEPNHPRQSHTLHVRSCASSFFSLSSTTARYQACEHTTNCAGPSSAVRDCREGVLLKGHTRLAPRPCPGVCRGSRLVTSIRRLHPSNSAGAERVPPSHMYSTPTNIVNCNTHPGACECVARHQRQSRPQSSSSRRQRVRRQGPSQGKWDPQRRCVVFPSPPGVFTP